MIADPDSRQARTTSPLPPRHHPRPGASCGLLIVALRAVACADRDAASGSSHPPPLELAVAPELDSDGGAKSCQTPAGQDDGWAPREGAPITLQAPIAFQPRFGGRDAGPDDAGPGPGVARPPVDNIVLEAIAALARSGVPLADPIENDRGVALTALPGAARQDMVQPGARGSVIALYGTNGRHCETCHYVGDAWSITPRRALTLFETTRGSSASNDSAVANDELDPLFRTIDAATSPHADVSSPAAREAAYALLLGRGLIRVGLAIPSGAEFSLAAVDDPYAHASASELSLYRRPLPMMNVRFLTDLMWDGRHTTPCATLATMLGNQASDAVRRHLQAEAPLSDNDNVLIQDRERIIFFAQAIDHQAGALDADGAVGGPVNLSAQPFYVGMNAYPGPDPRGRAHDERAFTLFDAWEAGAGGDARSQARLALVRGQALFNSRTFDIENVSGLNDELGMPAITGTCTTCHNAPNLGNNSEGLRFDIGIADARRRPPELPLYTLERRGTGETVQTMDPGRALVSGRWRDVGRFKVPTLRGLAARAPYFHDGSATSLTQLIEYLDHRFSIQLTAEEKSDLAAFLGAL